MTFRLTIEVLSTFKERNILSRNDDIRPVMFGIAKYPPSCFRNLILIRGGDGGNMVIVSIGGCRLIEG